jgi:hypothetical protein
MSNFVKFTDWEKTKYEITENKEKAETKLEKEPSTAQLIAELEDLIELRKKAVREKKSYDAQILELDIKLKKLDIEKAELVKKKQDLSEAKDIAKKKNIEGISHDQE